MNSIGSNYELVTFVVDKDLSYSRLDFKLFKQEMSFSGRWVNPYDKQCPLDEHQHYLVDNIQTALARINDNVQKLKGAHLQICRPKWSQANDSDEIQHDWLLLEMRIYKEKGPIGMVLLPYDEKPRVMISDRSRDHLNGKGWVRPMSTKSLYTLKEVADLLWDAPEILS